MAKQVLHGAEARTKLKAGVDTLADAVRVTLGARGRNVAIQKDFGVPHVTKDGVSIAREIELEDPIENMGAQMLIEAASKTVESAGDGTTTSVVLAQAIVSAGLKNVVAGANPMEIRTGIEKGVRAVVAKLAENSESVSEEEEIKRVATISANGDEEIGNTIASIVTKAGREGVITVEEGHTFGLVEKYVEGMQFDKGYISPYFAAKSEDSKVQIENPYIIITDGVVSLIDDIVPLIEKVLESRSKDILLIADDVNGEALSTLILNHIRGAVNIAIVKAPSFGDRKKAMLQDIAILTGGTVITSDLNLTLAEATLSELGGAEKVIVTKDSTTIIGGKGEKADIDARIEALKAEMKTTESDYDKEKLQERIAKLSGGVAVLEVGAATEVELKEKRDRIEDALSATRAALEEGIVAGGGIALIDAVVALDGVEAIRDEQIGVDTLRTALCEPFRRIMLNAGKEPGEWKPLVGQGKGYDVRKDEVVDMIKTGIVDPVKVTRQALENAASVAVMILTTEAVVVNEKKEQSEQV